MPVSETTPMRTWSLYAARQFVPGSGAIRSEILEVDFPDDQRLIGEQRIQVVEVDVLAVVAP